MMKNILWILAAGAAVGFFYGYISEKNGINKNLDQVKDDVDDMVKKTKSNVKETGKKIGKTIGKEAAR